MACVHTGHFMRHDMGMQHAGKSVFEVSDTPVNILAEKRNNQTGASTANHALGK
jgi:hypothetical protein